MIRDALDYLVDLGRDEAATECAPDYNATGRYFLRDEGGLVERFTAAPPLGRALNSTSDVAAYAARQAEDTGNEVSLWLDPHDGIVVAVDGLVEAAHDDGVIRHWARMPFPEHDVYQALAGITTRPFDQRGLVRFLRADLNGYVDPDVIETFRTINLTTTGDGKSVVRQGHASVDRSIAKKIQNESGGIPDEITVSVPVFDLPESRREVHPVRVLVDAVPDGEDVTFEVTPVRSDLAFARETAANDLFASARALLGKDANVVTYEGKP